MKKLSAVTATVFLLLLTSSAAVFAQDGHEYAPILEKQLEYKDWTFKDMKTGAPVNLRRFAAGKKLVLVVYFAPWCGNWKFEAPVVARLYDKYKAQGFDVVAVSNYGTAEDREAYFSRSPASYTVVLESEDRDAREKTAHYGYRQRTGDTRKWGSPYNVFLVPSQLSKDGDVLIEKTWIVNGELIEKDAEQ
ncbi:MAG: TlpA disulfide reductase family protein, partial [Pyrinomonadaceae bacterium]